MSRHFAEPSRMRALAVCAMALPVALLMIVLAKLHPLVTIGVVAAYVIASQIVFPVPMRTNVKERAILYIGLAALLLATFKIGSAVPFYLQLFCVFGVGAHLLAVRGALALMAVACAALVATVLASLDFQWRSYPAAAPFDTAASALLVSVVLASLMERSRRPDPGEASENLEAGR